VSPFSELHELPPPVRASGAPRASQLLPPLLLLLAFALFVAALLDLFSPEAAVRSYLVALVALVAIATVITTLSRFERPRRGRRRRTRAVAEAGFPSFLDRAARRLELASTTAGQYERLRRDLCEIAEQRLAGHGLRLASEQARGLLGEEAWHLLERPRPEDKFGPGPEPEELERLLAALERI
jgi:prepilin signal peptidase PulO-like enzyme (type II secretory pathway)